jgi:hypothetical protein
VWQPAHPADTDEPLDDDLDQGYAEEADEDYDDEDYDDEDYDDEDYDEEPGPAVVPLTAARLTQAEKRAALRAPFHALMATAATGYGSDWLVRVLADHGEHGASGAVVLGTCVATAVAPLVLRFRLRNRRRPAAGIANARVDPEPLSPEARRLIWKAGGFYAVWADAMALGAIDVLGPDGMAAFLLGGTAWLFRRWFRDHEIELPADTPPPVLTAVEPPPETEVAPAPPPRFPTPPPPDEGDLIVEEWNAEVAGLVEGRGENPIAPGATLGEDRTDLPHGYSWFVQLPRSGSITARQLCQRAEEVAFKLGYPQTHVILELLQEGHREDRLRLTVVTKDILKGKVPYPGPRYLRDGRIPIGLYADGSGAVSWRCKDEKGPLGGLVVGGSGAGKSDLLARIAMAMRYSEEVIVVVGDGDEQGRSAPLLKRVAYDFAAGAEQVKQQLAALEAWFHVRGTTMGKHYEGPDGLPVPITDPQRQQPAGKLMPCRRMPAWIWIIDEFYLLTKALGREFVQRVSDLRRAMRKRGGNIIVGTQSGGTGDFLGDDVLQSQLAGDNVALLRTKSATEQYAVGDFGCDPTTLPDDGGYGFCNDPEGRKVMFRGEYDEPANMARWVHSLPEYKPDLPSARVYAHKRPPTPDDPAADYHEAVADEAEILRRIDAGEPLPWEEQPEPEPEPEPPAWVVGGDGVAATGTAGQMDDWSLPAVPVAEPDSSTGATAEPEPRRPLNGSEVTVLRRLVAASGPLRNQQIVTDTGLSESVVSKAILGKDGLVARGFALRHGQGLHEATAAGRAAPKTTAKES